MTEAQELLPLGTAVEIEGDDGIYVIIARGFQKHDDGFLAGYKGVPHPQGAAAGVREIVIRQTQITTVLHRGHSNDEDRAFAEDLLENAKAPPKVSPPPAAEPALTVDLATPAAVPAPDEGAGAPLKRVKDATDPFSELRRKGRQA
ncbi:DUF4176 domain-containing protein [Rathayibacter iranicus]|uniref:DUF4176 domain-containing protein n=2 Tax=Rathayibacter iranicus TaxID=59737 RepID=A0AAD1AEL5_9MICO|nr:DUF4176 domain-containing protein [Rathayibacter iranicus]AZZ55987.1 DUF4176 domain-containing protein [Rathayibacter iranicus]MWV32528.1 DUF4176 domain-containing protein [Rathayibacter iranicus NCPPB 2253 = VKM Ac-1602]PPI47066.1 hypothetical protein C5E09_07940 [Rathayibacter iranicus]PPI60005.1 hypothetical protein C5E08_08870 [Rathayibacter iranicus]PPI71601.1 hypothetical protein C5E01_07905 [Rathayibacter iranicus]